MITRGGGQDGSVTTELVLITPVVLVLLGLVVVAGRISLARNAVVDATQQAARTASLHGNATRAAAAAKRTVAANLQTGGQQTCADVSVSLDTSRFARGGTVGVAVACAVDLSDVAFAGLPGRRTITAEAVEVIDVYRATHQQP